MIKTSATLKEILENYLPNSKNLTVIICKVYQPTITFNESNNMIHIENTKAGKNITIRVTEGAAKNREVRIKDTESKDSAVIEIGDFRRDFQQAIEILNSSSDVAEGQRKFLISILEEAVVSLENSSEAEKVKCRDKFNAFLSGAGNTLGKVLTKLAEISTIANFFGLGR